MKTTHLTLLLIAGLHCLGAPAGAQTGQESPAPAEASNAPDAAQVEESVKTLQIHLGQRQTRAAALRKDLLELDTRVEAKIDEIVKMLESVSDSQDSGTRVIRTKKEVMEALGKSIQRYQQRRAELANDLVSPNPTLDPETARKGLTALDQRMEKRVDQILNLSRTLADSNEFARYTSHLREERSGRWKEVRRENPRFRDAQAKETSAGRSTRAIHSALDESIQRLEDRNRQLQTWLDDPNYSDDQKRFIREEIARNEELLEARLSQLETVDEAGPGDTSGTEEIRLSDAMALDGAIRDLAKDLQWDINSVFRIYSELLTENRRIFQLQREITIRQDWLQQQKPNPAP